MTTSTSTTTSTSSSTTTTTLCEPAGLWATYIGTAEFTVRGNYADELVGGRRVRCCCGEDGLRYGTVQGASFEEAKGLTRVRLTPASEELTLNLVSIQWGVVEPGRRGNLAVHDHDAEDIQSSVLVDTKSGILATTPSESGKLAFATDTEELYLYDRSDWIDTDEQPLRYSFFLS